MPYKTDKVSINDPFINRRVKLLPCQKEMVLYWRELGESQRDLAKRFKVSRRTIQFILDPEKLKKNKIARKNRGGWKQYYDKDAHKEYMKTHRRYKHDSLKDSKETPKDLKTGKNLKQ